MKENNLTLGSLFDGSGGFPLGAILNGVTPLWASEIEPFPIRVTTRRLPGVKHLGDISKIKGCEIPPVDIITFGSPCQDMSIAGKRDGLDGSRSSLFYEAIRIIKEMREATDGLYPRFIIWENVTGAFSSNKGKDFRSVLQEIARIKDEDVSVPETDKWNHSGLIMGNAFSLAWRVLDAQYWGVPQRRKRIYLVADFRGRSAGKILFESEGMRRNPKKSSIERKAASGCTAESTGKASELCLNDQGGERMDITEGITATLMASSSHPPMVFRNHAQTAGYEGPLNTADTIVSRYGTGGNNAPFVVEDNPKPIAFVINSQDGFGRKTISSNGYIHEDNTSKCLDTLGVYPGSNQGGMAIVEQSTYGLGRDAITHGESSTFGITISENVEPTLLAAGPGAVATPKYSASKNSFFSTALKEQAETLVATDYKDPPIVNDIPDNKSEYLVRRLTPKECARLQGFPDWWCKDLQTINPSNEIIEQWQEIFRTFATALGKNIKQKSDKQIRKWLENPNTDSAEYKMWGNGVALPCVVFVIGGIVRETTSEE